MVIQSPSGAQLLIRSATEKDNKYKDDDIFDHLDDDVKIRAYMEAVK
jgi:hypothetical protein